jgi:hypothetical protein
MTHNPVAISYLAESGALVAVEAVNSESRRDFQDAIEHYLPPRGMKPAGTRAEPDLRLRVQTDVQSSLLRMESDLTVFAAEHLKTLVGVHSAAVVINGHCVVFCGYSHSGKSAIAREALARGFPVLSDEYVLIDPESGDVQGWPRPLRRREADGSVTRIPFDAASGTYRTSAIFSVSYDANCDGAAQLEQISPGQGATELLSHVVCAQRRPEDSVRAVAAVARGARAFTGIRGDASAFLDYVVELLAVSAP